MAYLTLNGWPVPVRSCEQADDSLAHDTRAINGEVLGEIRRERYRWQVQTALLTAAERAALRAWVHGQGIRWSFDADAYSQGKGLGPTSGVLTILTSSPTPKWGAGCASADAGDVIYTIPQTQAWTVGYWQWTGAAWELRVERSDGAKWVNATPSTAPFTVFVTGAALTIEDGSVLDDLVWYPLALPDEMITSWPTARAYAELPQLDAQGDFAEGLIVQVRGEGRSWSDRSVTASRGGLMQLLYECSFAIREV